MDVPDGQQAMRVTDRIHTYEVDWPLAEEMGVNRRGMTDYSLSIHVAETDEMTVQFGAGHETTTEQVAEIADDQNVEIVIVEHGDPDHYGGAPSLRGGLGIEVAVPDGDAEAITDDGIEFDYRLVGGEVFSDITIIDANGHTPGNLAFVFEGVLFAGDTVIGSDVELVADDNWSGPLALSPPNRNSGGDEAAQRSVRRLLEYDFDSVLLTHGANLLGDGRAGVETLVDDLTDGINRHDRGQLS